MSGEFNYDRILALAGRDLEDVGGRPTVRDIDTAIGLLEPWCARVSESHRELSDDATGNFVALELAAPNKFVEFRTSVNGDLKVRLSAGATYGAEGQAGVLSFLEWATNLDRQSYLATQQVSQLVKDFEATCGELGLPVLYEKHDHDEGWRVSYSRLGKPGKPSAVSLPEGHEPSVELHLMNVPTIVVRSSYRDSDSLRLAALSTSDANATVAKVRGWLREELVRIAATIAGPAVP